MRTNPTRVFIAVRRPLRYRLGSALRQKIKVISDNLCPGFQKGGHFYDGSCNCSGREPRLSPRAFGRSAKTITKRGCMKLHPTAGKRERELNRSTSSPI